MLTFKIQGQQRVENFLHQLPSVFDTREILDEGAAVLYSRMRARFLQQVDPNGQRWPESQAAINRARRGKGGGTLFDTGKLFHSIQLYADSPESRAIGTNVTSASGFPYGLAHQYGWGRNPVRQFLGFNQSEDIPYMSNLVILRISQHIERALA